ncbi:MAG: sigma-70 family RNA polymerase sigma factor [Lentisphaeraceae bacterium]|nr:sigma-70 family RNA polymerase sigma factor [Lentisphaeraceae bacterium]
MSNINTRETLLMRIRSRQDDFSWEEFTSAYERYIYLVVRGMNVGHHDAEDLVQSVMLAIWQKIPEFEYQPSRSKFRTWLCRITRNKVVDYIRSATSESRKVDGVVNDEVSLPEIEQLAEREWKAHITDVAWQNIQSEFNESTLKCFELMQNDGNAKEVAAKLEISESSVYVFFKRVKDRFIKEVRRLDVEWS